MIIAIEGMDGSGKTSISKIVANKIGYKIDTVLPIMAIPYCINRTLWPVIDIIPIHFIGKDIF